MAHSEPLTPDYSSFGFFGYPSDRRLRSSLAFFAESETRGEKPGRLQQQ